MIWKVSCRNCHQSYEQVSVMASDMEPVCCGACGSPLIQVARGDREAQLEEALRGLLKAWNVDDVLHAHGTKMTTLTVAVSAVRNAVVLLNPDFQKMMPKG